MVVMNTMVALMDDGVHGTQDCVNVYTSGKKQKQGKESKQLWNWNHFLCTALCSAFCIVNNVFFPRCDIKSLSQLITTMWEITKLVFVQCVCGFDFTAVPVKC